VKTAKEYLLQDFDHTVLSDEHLDVLESLIAQVQREAVEACAKECDSIAIGASDDPDMWSAQDCADAIRALLPKEEG
jgi:hypothetical protein